MSKSNKWLGGGEKNIHIATSVTYQRISLDGPSCNEIPKQRPNSLLLKSGIEGFMSQSPSSKGKVLLVLCDTPTKFLFSTSIPGGILVVDLYEVKAKLCWRDNVIDVFLNM